MSKLRKLLLVVTPLLLTVALLVSVLGLSACTGSSSSTAEVIEAYTVTSSAQSFHFNKTWVRTIGGEKDFELAWEGTYEAPDRTWVRQTSAYDPEWKPQTIERIMIGDRMYEKPPFPRPEGYEWEAPTWSAGEFLPSGEYELAEPYKSLLHVNCLTDVERLADEDLGGVVCHHYQGKLDMDKYVASVDWPGPDFEEPDRVASVIGDLKRADVTLEFWAGQEDGLIRRIVEDWDFHPEKSGYVKGYVVTEFQDYNSGIEVVSPVPHPIPIPKIAASSQQYGVTVTLLPHVTTLDYLEGELSEILGWRIRIDPEPDMMRATIYHYLAFDLGDGEAVVDGMGAGMGGGWSEGSGLVLNVGEYDLHEGQRIKAFAIAATRAWSLRTPCIAFTLVEKVGWDWRYADFELEEETDIPLIHYVNPESAAPIQVKVGQRFTISLESNPTAGYRLQLAKGLDESILKLVGSEYRPPRNELEDADAWGREVWTFETVGQGQTTIALKLLPPEEGVPPLRQRTILVNVS